MDEHRDDVFSSVARLAVHTLRCSCAYVCTRAAIPDAAMNVACFVSGGEELQQQTISLPAELVERCVPGQALLLEQEASLLLPLEIGAQAVFLVLRAHPESPWTPEDVARANRFADAVAGLFQEEGLSPNQRMRAFLGIVSHELRTPLTAVSMHLQVARGLLTKWLQEECDAQVQERLLDLSHLLTQAGSQLKLQERLVDDLQDVTRMQTNRLELRLLAGDLVRVVSESVAALQAAFPARCIQLSLAVKDELLVFMDADRITQVINNYVTNALKYGRSDGQIEVSLERRETCAYVAVHDEGPGLGAEELEKIWEWFYRSDAKALDPATQAIGGAGLGLGLAFCRRIIELHQGATGAESRPGVGSTFWFTLPLVLNAAPLDP
ncbi:phospho-acceptor domain-containing protein [Thermosporothrix hazakensis]|uniref:histidine kinase n=2 Tax=Thermosporothrix hazakensis TaxID=644383 RepID=A0A326UAJ0_THEHA|nr:HAMP domain-containing sensor histidine kinase [Thermosporothrix hazakensis]PZW33091.1 phospho-acceptor domain-containing protein [Thermosporothrix hazakensis]